MQDLILAGSGGCMRELLFQIEELNKKVPSWNVLGFVDEYFDENDENVKRILNKCPYLGKDEYLISLQKKVNVAVCVGEPGLRKKIVRKLKQNPAISFPNIILSCVTMAEDVVMGEGCIISTRTLVSTGVFLGDFVFLNIDAHISHEGKVGDFVTLSPRAVLAGNVTVGNETEIGMSATVIQGINIGERAVIGAGAVVVKDVESDVKVVGVPAKNILDKKELNWLNNLE